MPSDTLLVATRNGGKLRELAPMVEAAGLRAISLDDAGLAPSAGEDALEASDSFAGNALAKARHFHDASGGMAVLADDSGLAVDALGGRPGVRSKRWSGSHETGTALDDANNQALLAALRGEPNRRARYVCAAALVWSEGVVTTEGATAGRILDAPRGTNGFGYDPLFFSDDLAMTFGEAAREKKASVSHRARAVRAALEEFGRKSRPRGVDWDSDAD